MDYNTVVDKYFELKTEYENKYNSMKSRIINDKKLTIKQKRAKKDKLKIKCVSCKRNVGTIFELKNNEYRAVCGDTDKPCDLNIRIRKPVIIRFDEKIRKHTIELDEIKTDIIKLKLTSVFNLEDDEIIEKNFKKLTEKINDITRLLDRFKYYRDNTEDEETRNSNLKDLYSDLNDNIKNIQENMNEYMDTENHKYLQDTIEIYNDELRDILEKIRINKYRIQFMETDTGDNTFTLVQKKNTYEDNVVNTSNGEVIEYNI